VGEGLVAGALDVCVAKVDVVAGGAVAASLLQPVSHAARAMVPRLRWSFPMMVLPRRCPSHGT
jgi:hypothetical protein